MDVAGERSLVFGFVEVALVLAVLHFVGSGLALAIGPGSGVRSSLLFWGSYSVAVLAVVYLVRHFVVGWGLRDLGIRGGVVGQVLVGVVAPAPFLAVVALAYLPLLPSIEASMGEFLSGFGFAEALALVLVAYPVLQLVWASIHEEFLYRSYLTGFVANWAGPLAAVIASSTLFALGHYGLYSSYGLSPLGVTAALAFIGVFAAILGLEFLTYRSLVANVTTHTLVNTVPVVLAVVKHYGGWTPAVAAAAAISLVFSAMTARYRGLVTGLIKPLRNEGLAKALALGVSIALSLVLLTWTLNLIDSLLGLS